MQRMAGAWHLAKVQTTELIMASSQKAPIPDRRDKPPSPRTPAGDLWSNFNAVMSTPSSDEECGKSTASRLHENHTIWSVSEPGVEVFGSALHFEEA